MEFDTYIQTPLKRFDFVGRLLQMSTGDSLEVEAKYTHDGTGQSQSIVRRKRNTAMTGSLRWGVSHQDCVGASVSIFDYIAEAEDLCGQLTTIYFNGIAYNNMLITDIGVSLDIDSVDIIGDAQLSISFESGYVKKSATPAEKVVEVGTLYNPEERAKR